MISAVCASEQSEKRQDSGLGFKTISLSRVLDARAINLRIRHLCVSGFPSNSEHS